MHEVDLNIIAQIFRSQDVGFTFSPSIETAKGIICCCSLASLSKSSRVC